MNADLPLPIPRTDCEGWSSLREGTSLRGPQVEQGWGQEGKQASGPRGRKGLEPARQADRQLLMTLELGLRGVGVGIYADVGIRAGAVAGQKAGPVILG